MLLINGIDMLYLSNNLVKINQNKKTIMSVSVKHSTQRLNKRKIIIREMQIN